MESMQRPESIKNEPKWIAGCAKIRDRALDLIEGRISLIEAAVALQKLAIWTQAQADADLVVFNRVNDELLGLPVGVERSHWAPYALAHEDLKIQAAVEKWRKPENSKAVYAALAKFGAPIEGLSARDFAEPDNVIRSKQFA